MSAFQLHALSAAHFAPLFALSDAELMAQQMRRIKVEEEHSYPCRVSLTDAPIGSEVLLLHYPHHACDSPYRASGPIFVMRGAQQAQLAPDTVPDCLSRRLLSLRAYDASGSMQCADVTAGTDFAGVLHAWLARVEIAYVQIHNARYGCFMCEARRLV
ncbi:DUF1203 domain-containing protein [Massilia sp. W12]|uniref:DUF1203 domain-containing protein n=1 Tax=Massilia sp. W12 TaxID=3126507 RepID=UPI0030D3FD89